MTEEIKEPKLYPIQLNDVIISELYFKNLCGMDLKKEDIEDKIEITSKVGCSKFNEDSKIILVGLKVETDDSIENVPYKLIVDIRGLFSVDTENFDINNIEHWAHNAAPYILNPYIREHVYSLTTKAGVPPLLLPLLEVPTGN